MSVYNKSKRMVKERANFTIERDLMIKFRKYCKKNGISMSHKVEFWIRKFMKDKGEQNQDR